MSDEWASRVKAGHVRRLREHIEEGRVDHDLVDFLIKINMMDGIATTSSCSGRVAVIYSPSVTSKRDARILESWHDPDECRKKICTYASLSMEPMFFSWASLQAPVVNFIVRDLEGAETLVECAERAGMRRTGYRRYRRGGFQVWVSGGDKLHITLPASCSILLEACRILEAYKSRLTLFKECVLSNWPRRKQHAR